MNNRSILTVFAATLFTSAFLIFAVQPMVGKMLLPLLGGGPSVWNTAMVFFQAMLLAGYAYAHLTARFLPLRVQAVLHVLLLLVFTFALPIALPPDAQPPEQSGQAWWQLWIMVACVAGPFFVLAGSAPLLQHWFSASGQEDSQNPYFLYAISNAGSMLSLLSYPIIIEPFLGLHDQTVQWFGGYILLIGLTAWCGWLVRNGRKPLHAVTHETVKQISWTKRALWVFLAFVPSSLMLGVTTLITTDLSSVPFFWVLPLTLYLVTFIIAFATKPIIPLPLVRAFTPYLIAFTILSLMVSSFVTAHILLVAINLATFFFCAMLCHGELAESKPAPTHLTEFYLLVSLGGVLGGIFNALIAPVIFKQPMEYGVSMATIGFILWISILKNPVITGTFNTLHDRSRPIKIMAVDVITVFGALLAFALILFSKSAVIQVLGIMGVFIFLLLMVPNRFVFACCSCLALLMFQPTVWNTNKKLLAIERNYFGTLKVYTSQDINFFYHGTTLHGAQVQSVRYKKNPLTYYRPGGPASETFSLLDKRKKGPQDIAVIGLGVGSVACYSRQDRHFDFYEIDQDVVKFAQDPQFFSFLSGCGSPYDIILGDARLKMKDQPDQKYDMVFLDAFSSDNIPTHLLTREAMEMYFRLLKPNGILAMNISNRFIDLRKPLTATFREMNIPVYFKFDRPNRVVGEISELYTANIYAVASKDERDIAPFMENMGWGPMITPTNARPWTDDYANIFYNLFLWE